MSNWVYVCEKNEIDFEDLLRFDHEKKLTVSIILRKVFLLLMECALMKICIWRTG